MRQCSGGGQYTPLSHPAPPFPEPPQWVVKTMSHPVDVWGPWPQSAVPPCGGNPRGSSPVRGSVPTSLTQTKAPLVSLPHKIYPPFSYMLLPSPKSFTSRSHIPRARCRLCSAAVQSSSKDENFRPKYLKKGTTLSGVPYNKKTLPICSSILATTSVRLLLYNPRQHVSDVGCVRLSASCGTN